MSAIADRDPIVLAGVTYRSLVSREDCTAVIALERAIWGPDYDEAAPMAMLKVALIRGGILIGAFDTGADDGRLIGFVYSLPGVKDGRPTIWSFKLGVADRFRNAGVGYQLKRLQRARALDMGCDLIEWTFEPLETTYGRLNFSKLGVIVDEYIEDCYGSSTVPVRYRGHPTDRFIAAWHIREPRVACRMAADVEPEAPDAADPSDALVATVNETAPRGDWIECRGAALDLTDARLRVEIPADFSGMQLRAPELALAWREATRRIFVHYLSRGYRVTAFGLDRPSRKGAYILDRHATP